MVGTAKFLRKRSAIYSPSDGTCVKDTCVKDTLLRTTTALSRDVLGVRPDQESK